MDKSSLFEVLNKVQKIAYVVGSPYITAGKVDI
jgi:hypothetical protein